MRSWDIDLLLADSKIVTSTALFQIVTTTTTATTTTATTTSLIKMRLEFYLDVDGRK